MKGIKLTFLNQYFDSSAFRAQSESVSCYKFCLVLLLAGLLAITHIPGREVPRYMQNATKRTPRTVQPSTNLGPHNDRLFKSEHGHPATLTYIDDWAESDRMRRQITTPTEIQVGPLVGTKHFDISSHQAKCDVHFLDVPNLFFSPVILGPQTPNTCWTAVTTLISTPNLTQSCNQEVNIM